jgi:hypothetical protein
VSSKPDLTRPGGVTFFPPSRSHESDLVERLFGETAIPDGFSLGEEMLRRVREGSLRLAPTDESGWYDWQTWALEALAAFDRTPEAARVQAGDGYRDQLGELFKAVISLTRETHAKQLECAYIGSAMGRRLPEIEVWIRPELTLEPLRTYYQRRAESYEFVRRSLAASGLLASMRLQTPAGSRSCPMDEKIAAMISLFSDAATIAGEELGMYSASDRQTRSFRAWAAQPDSGDDVRMMVPAFYDRGRRQMKVWMVLGWSTRHLIADFAKLPSCEVLAGNVKLRFGTTRRTIAYPVFAEGYVSQVMDRDEFRSHCDRYQTRAAILEHLN